MRTVGVVRVMRIVRIGVAVVLPMTVERDVVEPRTGEHGEQETDERQRGDEGDQQLYGHRAIP
jgi:hypothetical protein